MGNLSVARRALSSAVAIAALYGLLLVQGGTESAFTSKTSNSSNTFGAAAFYGTTRLTENFSTSQASNWGSSWVDVSISSNKATSSNVTGGVGFINHSASNWNSWRWLSNTTAYNDQGVYLRHKFTSASAGPHIRIGVRCDGTSGGDAPTNCSWAEFSQADTATGDTVAVKTGNGGNGSDGAVDVNGTAWWNYRVEVRNNVIQYKRWADGNSEPTSWTKQWSIPSTQQLTSGKLYIESINYSTTASLSSQFDDITYYSY